jgi:hypothetical protein
VGGGGAQGPFLRVYEPKKKDVHHGLVARPKPTTVVKIRETLLNQSLTNAALVVRSFFLNWDFCGFSLFIVNLSVM